MIKRTTKSLEEYRRVWTEQLKTLIDLLCSTKSAELADFFGFVCESVPSRYFCDDYGFSRRRVTYIHEKNVVSSSQIDALA